MAKTIMISCRSHLNAYIYANTILLTSLTTSPQKCKTTSRQGYEQANVFHNSFTFNNLCYQYYGLWSPEAGIGKFWWVQVFRICKFFALVVSFKELGYPEFGTVHATTVFIRLTALGAY